MQAGGNADRSARAETMRVVCVVSLLGVFAALGLVFHAGLGTAALFTHFAYVPILLAALWWGSRGVVVALAAAAPLFAYHLAGIGAAELWQDAVRIAFFLAVALLLGRLSDSRRRSRRALRRSEKLYRTVIEKSLSGIYVYRDDRILFANGRLASMLGCSPADVLGRTLWDFIHPDDHENVRRRLRMREEGRADLHYENTYVRADGTALLVDAASSPIEWEGEPAVMVNLYDITGRKEAEEKERKLAELARRQEEQLIHSIRLAELGEMAAGVAHELNQPLTGIRTFARNTLYMLTEGAGEPGEVLANLRLISEQVDRASRIISQMRELTRKSGTELGAVDLNAVVEKALAFLEPEFRKQGVAVARELAPGLPGMVGDAIQIEQVFLNLFNNALHAMEDAPRKTLAVRTAFVDEGEPRLEAAIEDSGRGFAPADRQKIFTPFYTTRPPGKGTGLGLPISQNIVAAHGGTLEARGLPDRGATFLVRFPASRPPDEGDRLEDR